jgi:serine protease Do
MSRDAQLDSVQRDEYSESMRVNLLACVERAEAGRRMAATNALSAKSILHFLALSRCLFAFCLFMAVGGSLLLVHGAFAQAPAPALPAALERPVAAASEERAELRRELQRHAQTLDTQAAVVKIVAKLVGPAVVHIEADLPPDANPQRHGHRVEEAGSGVIIEVNDRHFVLTNRHVIRGAAPEAIRIILADGRRIHPMKDKVFEDAETDVAVMEISASDIVAAPLGDSDQEQIGDFVLAMGSPFGLSHSVTFGIISAKGRRVLPSPGDAKIRFKEFLQTDAAINPGNSGGPLINLKGEIVGINTAIVSNSGGNEGIGFAIPVNMFMIVARQLIETGKVKRGFLGITWNENFGPAMAAEMGLPRPMGTRVTGVAADSPAEAAKLQVGDVILEFDHTAVEDGAQLSNLVSLTEVGKTVPMLIFRDRKPITIMVGVGDADRFNK